MTMPAPGFNEIQIAAGKLTPEHITELVTYWQETHKLTVDGFAGERETIPSIEAAVTARAAVMVPQVSVFPLDRCWPLRVLPDGRKPVITSRFRCPERPRHPGVDMFYQRRATDPVMKIGDGGRTAKWWIPEGTQAIAVADAKVVMASKTPTGFRVWLDLAGDYCAGYFHLTELFVQVGDIVHLGEAVGIVGDNPIDTDPKHLHFELHRGILDHYPRGLVDPEVMLRDAPFLVYT